MCSDAWPPTSNPGSFRKEETSSRGGQPHNREGTSGFACSIRSNWESGEVKVEARLALDYHPFCPRPGYQAFKEMWKSHRALARKDDIDLLGQGQHARAHRPIAVAAAQGSDQIRLPPS